MSLSPPDAAPPEMVGLEEVPGALVLVDGEGRIAALNQRARALLPKGARPGSEWGVLLAGKEAGRFERFVGGLAVDATAGQEFKFATRAKDSALRVEVVRRPAGFSCSLHSIGAEPAPRRICVDGAEVSLPANFLAQLTHKLRNHVASAHAAAYLMRTHGRDLAGGHEQKWMEAIRQSVGSLRQALDQIDAFEQTALGSAAQGATAVDLPGFLESAAVRARQALPASTVTLRVLPGAKDSWRVEELPLASALDGLLANALKFGPPGSTASVLARATGAGLEIVVSDTGDGVAPGEAERLFTPFFQGRNARNLGGCGLGLAVARAAATRLKGTLTYEHTEGRGTEFRLSVRAVAGR